MRAARIRLPKRVGEYDQHGSFGAVHSRVFALRQVQRIPVAVRHLFSRAGATPAAGKTPATPATPNNPEAPDSPKSPLLKLWPRDAVKIFMPTCVKFHSELIEPCYCIITQVMEVIPHDEFLRLNEEGKMDTDPRIAAINERCLSKPRERKQ